MYSKEEILVKIRKWSKENDGRTPSEKVFYEYLGNFGVYDLHKLGWPYYGKLVEEVDLKPNIFDKTKYTRDDLCKLFISAIRKNDNWPSRGYLEVLHHQKSEEYPCVSTFYNKLGLVKTGDLPKAILDFIDEKEGYDDIEKICKLVYEKYKDKVTAGENIENGYVYLYKSGSKYRIGMTNNLDRRQGEVGVQLADLYELIHSIKTDDMRGVEEYWHRRLKIKILEENGLSSLLLTLKLSSVGQKILLEAND